jgi:hypothetical protein
VDAGTLGLVMVVASVHIIVAGLGMVRWARSSRDTELFDRPDEDESSRALSEETERRHVRAWLATEKRFHEQPHVAIMEADRLANDVLGDKGIDPADLDADSSEVPEVVERYRAAHEVAVAVDRRRASLRDLEEGMTRYRSLFATLFDRPITALGPGGSVDLDARR